MPTIADGDLLSCRLREPLDGVWRAECESDHTAALSGSATIEIDGSEWVGTVVRSTLDNGIVKTLVAGGAGALLADDDGADVGAKSYTSTNLKIVLDDILTATGETLDSDSDTLLGYRVPLWTRSAGPARRAVEALAAKVGLSWRVKRSGGLWFGTHSWPEADTSDLSEEEAGEGLYILRDAAEIEPGVTYNGERIREVVHTLTGTETVTEAWVRSASGAMAQQREQLRRETDYDRIWPAEVISQRSDNTLELKADDARIAGAGLDRVPIAPGIAGCKIEVPSGARCFIAFAAGDPSRPRVVGWDSETSLTLLTLSNGGSVDFVALAEKVLTELEAIKTWADAHTHPTGVGPSGVPTTPMTAPSSVAATKLKAE